MKREIKFRAWSKHASDKGMMYSSGGWEDVDILNLSDLVEPFEWTLMQYTGLKDKNGKEIYEGDILKSKMGNREFIGAMYFNQENAQFGFDSTIETEKNIPDHLELHSKPEIIGNIYENPELL